MEQAVVVTEHPIRDGRHIVVARLNTPRTLNALSEDMMRVLKPGFEAWAEDPKVAAVWLEGSGDKAFCAGGDVLALYRAMTEGKPSDADPFFAEEYRLDYRIHTYPKPVIVWGNGIVMGGGLGLMAGASFRVATENSHIAMPEVGIGLFPDVGASWFLNRMPQRTGLFLGLTGAPMNATDAIFLGLADRFITHDRRDATLEALATADWAEAESDAAAVNRILRECEADSKSKAPDGRVLNHYDQIQSLTDTDNIGELAERLAAYEGDDKWLQKAAANVKYGSPTSFAVFCRQMAVARHASLAEVFRLEMILAANSLRNGEFAEGIRALLVDKDRQPRWRYSTVASVEKQWIDQFFTPPWPADEHPLRDLESPLT